MTARLDPALCRRLAAECSEDDARMTPGPWVIATGSRFRGAVSALVGGVERQVMGADGQAPAFEDVPDPGQRAADNAAGTARTRNALAAIAEQLTAAANLAERPALTEQRVREVVSESIRREPWVVHIDGGIAGIHITAFAARAAKELAGATVGLSAVDFNATERMAAALAAGDKQFRSDRPALSALLDRLLAGPLAAVAAPAVPLACPAFDTSDVVPEAPTTVDFEPTESLGDWDAAGADGADGKDTT